MVHRSGLTGGRRALLHFFRTVIVVGLLIISLEIALWAYPPLAVVAVGWFANSPLCTAREVWQGAGQYYASLKLKDRIAAGMKLKQEDPAGYKLWSTPAGDFWNPAGSDSVLPIILAQQEADLYGLGGHGVKPGDIVLDCGAHIGTYAKRALKSGAKLVVAIEPAPANLECLRRNLHEEIQAGQVIIYAKGVWDKEEMLPLFENPENSAGDSFVSNRASRRVSPSIPLTTIDRLVEELGLDRVDFIKMDIKGAVVKALTGAGQVLRRDRPRLAISTEEKEDHPMEVSAALEGMKLGYRPACGICTLAGASISPDVVFFR
jgi:FkbM family methyltransferase